MSARAVLRKAAALLLSVLLLAACAGKKPAKEPAAGAGLDPEQARAIAVEAYLYGFPLVTMEMTRRVLTNAAEPARGRAPMNRFAHVRHVHAPPGQGRDPAQHRTRSVFHGLAGPRRPGPWS